MQTLRVFLTLSQQMKQHIIFSVIIKKLFAILTAEKKQTKMRQLPCFALCELRTAPVLQGGWSMHVRCYAACSVSGLGPVSSGIMSFLISTAMTAVTSWWHLLSGTLAASWWAARMTHWRLRFDCSFSCSFAMLKIVFSLISICEQNL